MRILIFCAIFALGAIFAQEVDYEVIEAESAIESINDESAVESISAESTPQAVKSVPRSNASQVRVAPRNRASIKTAPKSANAQNRAQNISAKSTKSTKKPAQIDKSDRVEPSGFFVGGGFGGAMSAPDIYVDTSYLLFTMDLSAGYKWFFGGGGFGMRLYLDCNPSLYLDDYNNTNRSLDYYYTYGVLDMKYETHNIALNYDLLFNWVKTRNFKFGMLLGFGLGALVSDYNGIKRADFSMNGNLGFRFVIVNHHAIELATSLRIAMGERVKCGYRNVSTFPYYYGYRTSYYTCENTFDLTFAEFPFFLRYTYTF